MASKRNRLFLRLQVAAVGLLCACRGDASGAQHSVPDAAADAKADAKADSAPAAEPVGGGGGGEQGSPAAAAPQPPGPPNSDTFVDELPRLHGQTESALRAEFGEPSSKREFAMADCCTEFEIELYNTYPPDSGHERVMIRDWTWKYEGYALTVWLHQRDGKWQVLDTSRYSDDVEF